MLLNHLDYNAFLQYFIVNIIFINTIYIYNQVLGTFFITVSQGKKEI